MKIKHLLTFAFISFFAFAGFSQTPMDITGTWLNEKKDSKIVVYKKGNQYFGKIIWLKNKENSDGTTPRVDENNPDKLLRKRPLIGMNILKDLVWDEDDKEFNDGEIYDPRSGNTYSCYVKFISADELYLKGYIGFSLLGRSTTWTRVSN